MYMLFALIAVLMLVERIWKHWAVVRFFCRPLPSPTTEPKLISILQPILSGDPTLPACLEHNLTFRSRYPREYIWLVDSDDLVGQRLCQDLVARYPESAIQLLILPPPAERQNPKMVKLTAGANIAKGDVICVLDDDTQLPDEGLEQCIPFLDRPGVGLAFGLPYYISFSTLWSSLVAYFVNSNSLLTYIPYISLTEPFTINGMFYAIKRNVFDIVGGFNGLEGALADDFAVAQHFRAHGYRLAQTPLRHGISTYVTGPRHYLSLMQRWFIFPRESLMRHTNRRERFVLYGLGMSPALFPLLLVIFASLRPSLWSTIFILLYFLYNYLIFAHFNIAFLNRAAPWGRSWWVPVIQLIFPIQLLIALLSPQRIVWRGHVMQADRGGGFRFVLRRVTTKAPRHKDTKET